MVRHDHIAVSKCPETDNLTSHWLKPKKQKSGKFELKILTTRFFVTKKVTILKILISIVQNLVRMMQYTTGRNLNCAGNLNLNF